MLLLDQSKYFIICTDKSRVIQIWFCKFVLWSYFLQIYVPRIHFHVFLLVFHQLLPLTFFRGTNIFCWRCDTLQHTDSSESRNRSLSVSLRKTPVCSLNKQTCRSRMHKQKKLTSMVRLCLSFDIHHFEIEELAFLTLWWDFRKESSFSHRFRMLILTRSVGLNIWIFSGRNREIFPTVFFWFSPLFVFHFSHKKWTWYHMRVEKRRSIICYMEI